MYHDDNLPMPSVFLSLIPIAVVVAVLGFSVFVAEAEPHIALFLGAVTAGLAAYRHGYTWNTIEEGFKDSINRAISSLIILLIIGMIIGVWIASGIVPAMMYYGFEILVPEWFLPIILILCSIMSVVTGSSWTTIGTIGVAALGIGQGLGIPPAAIAGAVVSGAFFGDKISPMSDSTNLTPSVLGVDLYDHIKHMLYTTVPSFIISLIVFGVMGWFLSEGTVDAETIASYQNILSENFEFSLLLLLPPVVVVALILRKTPAIPSLIAGVMLGGFVLLNVQGHSLEDFLHILYDGFVIQTGWEEMDELLSTGGMTSMYSVVSLGIMALAFGGIMNRCNMLRALVSKMTGLVGARGRLTATTIVTALLINIFGANQYLAVIIPGQMFEGAYKRLGLKLNNLTRALEAGGTLTAPLIPWNSSGAFVISVMAVNPLVFAPYAVLCWITPLITMIYGFVNFKMDNIA